MAAHIRIGAAASAMLAFFGASASAQTPEEFYRGRKMDMIIGYSAGGTYDLYARLVARQLGAYMPGNPLIVARNMPGGGSRTAVAWVYTAMGDKMMKVDTRELIYIGNPMADNNTTALWHTSPVKTIDDAKRIEVPVGATGGSTSSQYPKAMNALLGTKFKIIYGYPGGNDINLAMERGEVAGRGSNSWAAWKSTRPEWVRDKKLSILVQIGLTKAPDLPDVPLLMDLAQNESDRAVLKLLSASTTIGRPIFTTPQAPADRVRVMRESFEKMVRDTAFLEQARRESFDINPVSGEELQRIVAEIVATPKSITDRLQDVIGSVEQNR